jgi:hypothetical protein
LILGFSNGNWINFIILDFLSFCLLINIYLIDQNNYKYISLKIVNLFSLLIFLAFICGIYFTIVNGFQVSTDVYQRLSFEEDTFDGSTKSLFYTTQISILLLPFLKFVNKKRKYFIILGCLFFIIINFLGLSRANILASLVSILITLYIYFKYSKNFFVIRFILLFSIFTAISTLIYLNNSNTFNNSYSLFSQRIINISEDDFRDVEEDNYFSSISKLELLFGKGMGAANKFTYNKISDRGIMMLHRGENNIIMKGGILLLILFYGSAFKSLYNLIKSKDIYSDSWAAVIIVYLVLERGHQQFSSPFMLLLFCIGISYGLVIPLKKQKK